MMAKFLRTVAPVICSMIFSTAVLADTHPDIEFGEYLSSECTACHLLSGKESNIPSIINWEPEAGLQK